MSYDFVETRTKLDYLTDLKNSYKTPWCFNEGSRVAQSVRCLATGWTTGRSRFDPWQRRRHFSSSFCVQTGSGADPASCTMRTGGPFPGAKARPGRDANHSPPSSREWVEAIALLPPSAFMACSGTALALRSFNDRDYVIVMMFLILHYWV
jgi:hypothetical protein